MKKNKLISLGTTLAAGMLLVACAQSTNNSNKVVDATGEVNNQEEKEERSNPSSGNSDIKNVTIHLRGTKVNDVPGDEMVIKTRRGTRWKAIKGMAPEQTDFIYPDQDYINGIAYKFEDGNYIDDTYCINEDKDLYLELSHDAPTEGDRYEATWCNDNGDILRGGDYYRPSEHPYYRDDAPHSTHDYNLKFVGWGPSEIDPKDHPIGEQGTIYTALYAYNTLKVTFCYNYEGDYGPFVERNVTADGSGMAHASELTPTPLREGYTFSGWYKDHDCEEQFIFSEEQIVDDDTKIFAKWDKNNVSVTVDPNGGKFAGDDGEPKKIDTPYGTTWGEFSSEEEGGHAEDIEIVTKPEGTKDYVYKRYDDSTFQWVDLDDEYVISSDTMIKAFYEYNKVTLNFEDEYSGADLPMSKEINVGTKWIDIKSDCQLSNIKDGYHFDHYYIDNGAEAEPTVIDDSFVFDGYEDEATVTFHVSYNVDITFDNDDAKGLIGYRTASLPTGTVWGEVAETYEPYQEIFPYVFKNYEDSDGNVVDSEYVIKKPIYFISQYDFAEANDFSTDDWTIFTNFVHGKTYEQITSNEDPESPYYEEWHEHGDTFVGLTRDIEIYGNTYQVRVVDENTNAGVDDELFTFEFVQTLDLPLPFSLDMDNNDYQDSLLNTYLNNYFIYSLPKPLLENDALVDKQLKSFAPSTFADEEYNAKIFLPSASQLGFTQYPDGESIHDEGAVFAYYDGKSATNRVKKIGFTSTNANYWLRSPDITGALETAWTVNDSGNLGDEDGNIIAINSAGIYFAPAFAIK